jgi:hypothetical protein
VAERTEPRESFSGHELATSWRGPPAAPARLPRRRGRGFAAVRYVHDILDVDGDRLPSKRLAYRCDGRPNLEQLMVSIDLSDIHFE